MSCNFFKSKQPNAPEKYHRSQCKYRFVVQDASQVLCTNQSFSGATCPMQEEQYSSYMGQQLTTRVKYKGGKGR